MKKITLLISILLLISTVLFGCTKKDEVKIGISWAADEIDEDAKAYEAAIKKAGGTPIFLDKFKNIEEAREAIKDLDGIVITGGEDINPALYNEEPSPQLEEVNEERDTSDVALLNAVFEKDFPTLATCRGMQLTNALSGGSLYQDIPTMYETKIIHRDPKKENYVKHEIEVFDGNILADALGGAGNYTVNSWQHQAIKEVGDNLKVLAKAPDGIIEAMQKTDKNYYLCVQFHPEGLSEENDKTGEDIYKALIAHAKEYKESKTQDKK